MGGNSARVGYAHGATASYERPGSHAPGAFLDGNSTSGLIHQNNDTGVLLFSVRNCVIYAPPNVTISAAPGLVICEGESSVLTANPAGGLAPYTYIWSGPGGITSGQTRTATAAGTYAVTITDSNLNTGATAATVTVNVPTAKWTWARQAGSSGSDSGNAVAVNVSGDVFVTGSFSGTMSFPNGSGINSLTASGGTDIFLAKYNAAGTLQWAKRAGGLADDAGNGVAVDGAGNAYVTGSYSGAAVVDFGNGNTLPATAGGSDIFVAKYGGSGNCVWVKREGGAGNDIGLGIARAPNGEVLVTGSWGEQNGLADVFVLKLSGVGSPSGSAISTGPAGHSGVGRAIAVDLNNDVYVAGSYSLNSISFLTGNSPLTAPAFTDGYTRMFVVKFPFTVGTTLNASWLRHSSNVDASFSHDARGIAVDPTSASVYVTGYFNGVADFGDGSILWNSKTGDSYTNQLYDYFIVKLNSADGSRLWEIQGDPFGENPDSDDETRGIAVDNGGNPCITGFLHPDAPNPFISAGPTVLVASYSSAGDLRWTRNAVDVPAGSPQDAGLGIAVDGVGCMHVTGEFTEVLSFPPAGQPVASLSSIPSNVHDMFVAKMCPICGDGQDIDTDGDGHFNLADPDDDNDGLPDTWEVAWGLNPLNLSDAGLDLDGDGIINTLEYGFGLNPVVTDGGPIVVTNGVITHRGLPTLLLTNTVNGADFRALFGRRKDYLTAGITYTAQFSGDLLTWANSGAVPTVIADDGEIEAVTVPHPFFVNGRKARFFRVQVTTVPIP